MCPDLIFVHAELHIYCSNAANAQNVFVTLVQMSVLKSLSEFLKFRGQFFCFLKQVSKVFWFQSSQYYVSFQGQEVLIRHTRDSFGEKSVLSLWMDHKVSLIPVPCNRVENLDFRFKFLCESRLTYKTHLLVLEKKLLNSRSQLTLLKEG